MFIIIAFIVLFQLKKNFFLDGVYHLKSDYNVTCRNADFI